MMEENGCEGRYVGYLAFADLGMLERVGYSS